MRSVRPVCRPVSVAYCECETRRPCSGVRGVSSSGVEASDAWRKVRRSCARRRHAALHPSRERNGRFLTTVGVENVESMPSIPDGSMDHVCEPRGASRLIRIDATVLAPRRRLMEKAEGRGSSPGPSFGGNDALWTQSPAGPGGTLANGRGMSWDCSLIPGRPGRLRLGVSPAGLGSAHGPTHGTFDWAPKGARRTVGSITVPWLGQRRPASAGTLAA